jgi:hypothetical protein
MNYRSLALAIANSLPPNGFVTGDTSLAPVSGHACVEVTMAQAKQVITAPRIEVVLVPEAPGNINTSSALFDIWLVLHMPDGRNPETVRLDDGPFDRDDAIMKMSDIWGYIGKEYAEPTAKRGL